MVTGLRRFDIDDVEQYKLYVAAIAEPLRNDGARASVHNNSQYQLVEDRSRQRRAVIEFPPYQEATKLRVPEPVVEDERQTPQV